MMANTYTQLKELEERITRIEEFLMIDDGNEDDKTSTSVPEIDCEMPVVKAGDEFHVDFKDGKGRIKYTLMPDDFKLPDMDNKSYMDAFRDKYLIKPKKFVLKDRIYD